MFLALKEMRRAPVRFGLLVVATGLLVFLILVQQALQDGLITSFIGAIRNQSAPVLVYSVDAQRTLQGSVIPPPLEQAVRATDGVATAARVVQGTFTVEVEGRDGESDAALVGSDDDRLARPSDVVSGRQPAGPGEAVGSDVDFAVGDRVTVLAAGGRDAVTVTVVGLARDVQLSVTPTLFTDLGTVEAAVRAANPDATDVLPNALAVQPGSGVTAEEVADRINATAPDAEALTRDQAAERAPGVEQVRQSFRVIFALYALVVPLVTGLFFLIATLQKARSLTLLRAVGARAGTLAVALLAQVAVVIGLGLALGIALYAPLSQSRVGGLALRFDAGAVVTWSLLLLALGLVSAVASLRRVLRIDPIEATTVAGVR
ncbi:MAG TPA: ABC transporter permease [Acidimicrobiales bacterium]